MIPEKKTKPGSPKYKATCQVCKLPLVPEKNNKVASVFCSPRCQWIDLGKWIGGDYAISDPSFPGLDPSA
jgi:endogenous inhibitor of DNA gyrase (YacG/DUF329 family)